MREYQLDLFAAPVDPGPPEAPIEEQATLFEPALRAPRRSDLPIPRPEAWPPRTAWRREVPAGLSPVELLEPCWGELPQLTRSHVAWLPGGARIASVEPTTEHPSGRKLRLHPGLAEAPAAVHRAVLRLFLGEETERARRRLARRIRTWCARARPAGAEAAPDLRPGRWHDLAAYRDRVRSELVPEVGCLPIGFARRASRQRLGRLCPTTPEPTIEITAWLDHPVVPAWYLAFLVHHEMLHALHPPRVVAERLAIHPPEFAVREGLHPDLGRARRFETWLAGPAAARLIPTKTLPSTVPRGP